MRIHLFEFRSDRRKLKCLCGWERTLKTADVDAAYEKYALHVAEADAPETK
jgi:hypothetical protein